MNVAEILSEYIERRSGNGPAFGDAKSVRPSSATGSLIDATTSLLGGIVQRAVNQR
jgi:hypothetical protein